MNTASKILLVEDDLNLGFLLSEYLEGEGFEVKLCRDGESGETALRRSPFDLCILDVMMPKMDGFALAAQLKILQPDTPFLFLTARTLKEDKLKAFGLGAEDYVTKPFDEEELLCRIKILIRRRKESETQEHSQPQKFQIGLYQFDHTRQELSLDQQSWRLTSTESAVLHLLCLNQNQILRRDEAVESIYGKKDYFLGRSFDVFISKLRKMLQSDPRISIENVFRVGFILNVKE